MKERSFNEMIAYFNRRVSEMDIDQGYKFELLGMVTALGYKHEKTAQPEIIRCKDCKFWTHIKRTNRYWCKTDDGLYDLNPSPDDFCSRAERRTDD